MDDDPVLRALGAELERDDPRLAALLRTGPTPAARRVLAAPPSQPIAENARKTTSGYRRRPPSWLVGLGASLAGVLVIVASIPLGLAAFGVLGLILLVLSPLAACWWCATADELRPPDRPADC